MITRDVGDYANPPKARDLRALSGFLRHLFELQPM
jgi:hypothetical protein